MKNTARTPHHPEASGNASGPRLEVVPFQPLHLDIIRPRAAELLTFGLMGFDRERALSMAAMGPAFTLLASWPGTDLDGEDSDGAVPGEALTAVACGGVMLSPEAPDGSRVGDAWAVTGRAVDELPLAFHRAVRDGLAGLVARHRLRRVQALCLADHERSRQWLKRLGFRRETREPGMLDLLPGAAMHLYALRPELARPEEVAS